MSNFSKASKSNIRAKILWRNPTNKETIITEKGWSAVHTHNSSIDGSIVMFKAGNKPYILSSNSESSHNESKTIYPQSSLLKKYRYTMLQYLY